MRRLLIPAWLCLPLASLASAPASLDSLAWKLSAGPEADTLKLSRLPQAKGFASSLEVHSKAGGWTAFSPAAPATARGVDSLRATLSKGSVRHSLPARFLDRRFPVAVTYRDGTKGSVLATRIGDRTWMAQNLAYDIPGDTLDLCFENKPENCPKGRFYTLSQALHLVDASGRIRHECDTLPDAGHNGSACPKLDPQGACPSHWHVPTAAEWDELTTVTDSATGSGPGPEGRLYGGDWGSFKGLDWFGFDLQPMGNLNFRAKRPLQFSSSFPDSRKAPLWSATPDQDQALQGTAFEASRGHYGTHAMWYYNPLKPREAAAYPLRCVLDP